MAYGRWMSWAPYVPVAERRQNGARHAAKLRKQGRAPRPVVPGGRGRALAGQHVAQIVALQQLHGHEDPALVLAEVVHGDDVGMREQRGRLCLALEPLLRFVVAPGDGRHGLDGHEPIEDGVFGLVDRTHGPLADLGEDFVFPDSVQAHETEGLSLSAQREGHSGRRENEVEG